MQWYAYISKLAFFLARECQHDPCIALVLRFTGHYAVNLSSFQEILTSG